MFLVVHSIDEAQPILLAVDQLVSAEEHKEGITYVTMSNGHNYKVLNTVEDIFEAIASATTQQTAE